VNVLRRHWPLLLALVCASAMGLLFLGSAAEGTQRAAKQCLWLAAGLGAMAAVAFVDYHLLLRRAWEAYGFVLLLLVLILFTRPVSGARSWFKLGFFSVQPSEFMKPALILLLARVLSTPGRRGRLQELILPLALPLAPVALILRQPDLGTAGLFIPLALVMLYVAGTELEHLGMVLGGMGVGAGMMWWLVMKEYQRRRILAWLYPEQYGLRDAWQLRQSLTAIGSGGFWGKGLHEGALNKLGLIPVKETDLIYSVVCEEWGFWGGMMLLGFLAAATILCISVAAKTREPAGRLVALGAGALLGSQALLNLCVAVGLLPTTGVTLPFVSYGGSSMLSCYICVGLALGVSEHERRIFT